MVDKIEIKAINWYNIEKYLYKYNKYHNNGIGRRSTRYFI